MRRLPWGIAKATRAYRHELAGLEASGLEPSFEEVCLSMLGRELQGLTARWLDAEVARRREALGYVRRALAMRVRPDEVMETAASPQPTGPLNDTRRVSLCASQTPGQPPEGIFTVCATATRMSRRLA